jgi:hypothetical protein
MRKAILVALAAAAFGCGGGGSDGTGGFQHIQHPTLGQDYSSDFAGVWTGGGTVTMGGQTQTSTGSQQITRTGFNTLSVTEMCPGVNGVAGLDSSTTFSVDPLRCAPMGESCGPVTLTYRSGIGVLDPGTGTLTMTLTGTAAGCGMNLDFTMSFSGTRTAMAGTGESFGEGLFPALLASSPALAF